MARGKPAGVIDLTKAKARLGIFRRAQAKGGNLAEADVRMDVREFNHQAAVERETAPVKADGAPTLSQEEVHYRDGTPAQQCGNCSMFLSPDACTLVTGEIREDGVCDRWESAATG